MLGDFMEPTPPARSSRKRLTLLTGFCVLVAGALALLVLHRTGVSPREVIGEVVDFVRGAGPLVFFAAMAVLPSVGFPLSPFMLSAGPVFGPVMGVGNVILCAILALACNVALSYWLSSRAFRPLFALLLKRLGYTLPTFDARRAWLLTLVVRITPGPPFFAQSYLLGLTRVPFGTYMLFSTLVPSGYQTAIILGGDALLQGKKIQIVVAAVLLAAFAALLYALRRKLARKADPAAADTTR